MLAHLVELVLPRRCVGCGLTGAPLCDGCGAARPIERYVSPVGTVHAACSYRAAVRRAVIAYKERGRRELAVPLGALLAGALHRAGPDPPGRAALVPVPSSASARRGRDFDHIALLAETAAALPPTGGPGDGEGPPVRKLLTVRRRLPDSAGLGARERRSGLAGAFAARPRRPDEPPGVVIVDDVITTGASVREAARALQAAGWRVQGVAVVAATPRRIGAERRPRGMPPSSPIGAWRRTDHLPGTVRWSPEPGGVNVRTT